MKWLFMSDMEQFRVILLALVPLLIFSSLAFFCGYFHLKKPFKWNKLHLTIYDVGGAFLVLLIVKLLIGPAVFQVGYYLVHGKELTPDLIADRADLQGWLHVTGILILFGMLRIYMICNRKVLHIIETPKKWLEKLNQLFLGVTSWFIVYPWVVVAGKSTSMIVNYFFKGPLPEQGAIIQIRALSDHQILFWVMSISVIVIIPMIEEFLFRGLLQTWMRYHLGKVWAILLTSLIFATAHFSVQQGIFNFELIASLFVLSCFLGYLWERQGNLIASVTLHATVNAVSMGAIFGGL